MSRLFLLTLLHLSSSNQCYDPLTSSKLTTMQVTTFALAINRGAPPSGHHVPYPHLHNSQVSLLRVYPFTPGEHGVLEMWGLRAILRSAPISVDDHCLLTRSAYCTMAGQEDEGNVDVTCKCGPFPLPSFCCCTLRVHPLTTTCICLTSLRRSSYL